MGFFTCTPADGSVLLGGLFTTANGVSRNRIARLNTDGSLDVSFQNGMSGADNWVYSVAVQTDGRIWIGGLFTFVNDAYRGRVARLNADGSLDTIFNPGANNSALTLAVQSAGKCGKVLSEEISLRSTTYGFVFCAALCRNTSVAPEYCPPTTNGVPSGSRAVSRASSSRLRPICRIFRYHQHHRPSGVTLTIDFANVNRRYFRAAE